MGLSKTAPTLEAIDSSPRDTVANYKPLDPVSYHPVKLDGQAWRVIHWRRPRGSPSKMWNQQDRSRSLLPSPGPERDRNDAQ